MHFYGENLLNPQMHLMLKYKFKLFEGYSFHTRGTFKLIVNSNSKVSIYSISILFLNEKTSHNFFVIMCDNRYNTLAQ